jgi:hypothetical protein
MLFYGRAMALLRATAFGGLPAARSDSGYLQRPTGSLNYVFLLSDVTRRSILLVFITFFEKPFGGQYIGPHPKRLRDTVTTI